MKKFYHISDINASFKNWNFINSTKLFIIHLFNKKILHSPNIIRFVFSPNESIYILISNVQINIKNKNVQYWLIKTIYYDCFPKTTIVIPFYKISNFPNSLI